MTRDLYYRRPGQPHFLLTANRALQPPLTAANLRSQRRFSLLLALLTAAGSPTSGQSVAPATAYVRENWTVADGLPINTITALIQTRDGYLWLGTNDGVARFDGVRFTVYNADNTRQIPSNRIVSLHEDRAGVLWILTEQQHLIRYSGGRFTHINAEQGLTSGALRLSEMHDGTLVLATSRGAGIIQESRFTPIIDSLTIDYGYGAAVRRRDGSAWIMGRTHLWRVANGRIENVTPAAIRKPTFSRLELDADDRVWLADTAGVWTGDGQLHEVRRADGPVRIPDRFAFDTVGRRTWVISQNTVDVATDATARLVTRFVGSRGGVVTAIVVDSAGAAWYGNGPELFRDGRRIAAFEGVVGDHLAPGAIVALTIDREGSVWVGTRASGLHRLKPSLFNVISTPEGLGSGNVYSVYEDSWGSVWVGTLGGGVSRIDGGTRVTTFAATPTAAGVAAYPPHPRDFLSDRPDRLWIAALDGIRSCTLPAFRCTTWATPALGPYVHALHADAQGRLWAGSEQGVFRFDDGQWQPVSGWPLKDIQARAFVITPDGALWIATGGGGVVRYHADHFTQVSVADGLPSAVVRALYVDPDGYLWIGTEGRGLARLDPRAWSDSTRDRRIVRVGTEHGLYDGAIHRILADDAGRLWMNTNRGIFWVPRSELAAFADGRAREVHSTAYTERDGLRNREGNGGVQSAGTRTKDGRLWFPTQDGVAIVDPRAVTARRVAAPAVIERIVAGDSSVIPSGAGVSLGVDQRNLTIEYTALSLLEPKNLRFRYRLEPYDAAWVDAGNRRTAFYTRVPPGSYTFRVQASSPDAEWTSSGAELPLSLAFRAWETKTFRFGGALLLLIAAAGGAVLWSQRVRRRAAELELVVAERTATLRDREQQLARQNVQLSELDRAKSRFFANVSHEFRTPLTLTIGPLEGIADELRGVNGRVARAFDMSLRNARRLMRLVNQILDVAKLEAGQMRLNRRTLDLASFVRSIVEAFVPTAESKGVVLDVDAPSSLRCAFDSDALEKVVTNLVSNALKFTPGGGRVTITLRETSDGVMLRVADTGPGIPAEHLAHVFERFYQVDETLTRAEAGTGIGLALVQELVTLHGGTIEVSSGDLAPGAVFTVTLPLGEPDVDTEETRAVVVDGSEPAHETSNAHGPLNATEPVSEIHDDIPTLLIVDDSADLRAYVRDHFASRFRVLEAANGSEGIAIARRELPDVIVSDLMMPDTDGHALVRAVRGSPDTDFLPIILLTAHTGIDQRLAGLHGGADDYLTKPFDMRELSARVENLIALRRRLRERFIAARPIEVESQVAAPVGAPLDETDRAFMAKLEATVARHLADPDFGVTALADAMSQDRSHLFRRTRDVLGASPSDLLRQARLQRGATLLTGSSDTVAEIAYAVGFNSVSYFSRAFQAEYGVTPTAFRSREARS